MALAAGQGGAAVADHGVIAVGHAGDEFVGVGQLCCSKDLVFGGIGSTEGDVVGDGAVQQHGFLQHESDLGAQTVQGAGADVDTVDADASGVGVSEARDHAQHGGFAAAGRPDDSHHLAGVDVEGDVVQHGNVGVVGEGHVLKGDLAAKGCGLAWGWTLRDHRVGVADRGDPLEGHRYLGDGVGHLGQIAYGGEEAGQVGQKDRQRPDGHHTGEDQQ